MNTQIYVYGMVLTCIYISCLHTHKSAFVHLPHHSNFDVLHAIIRRTEMSPATTNINSNSKHIGLAAVINNYKINVCVCIHIYINIYIHIYDYLLVYMRS